MIGEIAQTVRKGTQTRTIMTVNKLDQDRILREIRNASVQADYVVVTAGQYDLVVELVASDRRELLEVTNRMRALDEVVSTETFLYLDLVKQLYDWGARVADAE